MRETVRAYAEIYGDLGLFTALEISLRESAQGFESLPLRQSAVKPQQKPQGFPCGFCF